MPRSKHGRKGGLSRRLLVCSLVTQQSSNRITLSHTSHNYYKRDVSMHSPFWMLRRSCRLTRAHERCKLEQRYSQWERVRYNISILVCCPISFFQTEEVTICRRRHLNSRLTSIKYDSLPISDGKASQIVFIQRRRIVSLRNHGAIYPPNTLYRQRMRLHLI